MQALGGKHSIDQLAPEAITETAAHFIEKRRREAIVERKRGRFASARRVVSQ